MHSIFVKAREHLHLTFPERKDKYLLRFICLLGHKQLLHIFMVTHCLYLEVLPNSSWSGSSALYLQDPSQIYWDQGRWWGRGSMPTGAPLQCTLWPHSAVGSTESPNVSQQAFVALSLLSSQLCPGALLCAVGLVDEKDRGGEEWLPLAPA